MDSFPKELYDRVFLLLEQAERRECRLVCKAWEGLLARPVCWADTTLRSRGRALAYALKATDRRAAQWLASVTSASEKDAYELLKTVCARGGDVEAAQWVVERYALTPVLKRKPRGDSLLTFVCIVGNVGLARWLAATFGLPTKRLATCAFLLKCCRDGHLRTAQCVVEACSLSASEVRASGLPVLLHACENGHRDIARWLVAAFGTTADEVRAARVRALAQGHSDVAQWLATLAV